jgi:peptidoglycan/xylan/chitin deacetylase (PgdA/CDA1 family)
VTTWIHRQFHSDASQVKRQLVKWSAKAFLNLHLDDIGNSVLEYFYRSAGSRLQRFQILVYHRVSHDSDPFFPPVSPGVFEQQLEFLKQSYNVLDLGELVEHCKRGSLPDRAVAITFDDGYEDNYSVAYPILKNAGLRATIFVTTGVIETGKVLWHHRIFRAFRYATVLRVAEIAGEPLHIVLESERGAKESLGRALTHARTLPAEKCVRFAAEIEEKLRPDFNGWARVSMLKWGQMREMYRYGIRFGSHTVTHPILTRIDDEQIKRELRESRAQLQEEIGGPIAGFAYPNGQACDYDARTIGLLKQAGYEWAVTTRFGYNTRADDVFQLKRDQPWQSDVGQFRMGFFLQRHGLQR